MVDKATPAFGSDIIYGYIAVFGIHNFITLSCKKDDPIDSVFLFSLLSVYRHKFKCLS
jgi:hypothetical protein